MRISASALLSLLVVSLVMIGCEAVGVSPEEVGEESTEEFRVALTTDEYGEVQVESGTLSDVGGSGKFAKAESVEKLFQEGDTVTAVATPTEDYYVFSHWTGDFEGADQDTTFVITEDMVSEAHFAVLEHQLELIPNPAGTGGYITANISRSPHAKLSVGHEASVLIEAVAYENYQFSHWIKNDERWTENADGETPSAKETIVVTEDVSYVAVFEEKPTKVTIKKEFFSRDSDNRAVDHSDMLQVTPEKDVYQEGDTLHLKLNTDSLYYANDHQIRVQGAPISDRIKLDDDYEASYVIPDNHYDYTLKLSAILEKWNHHQKISGQFLYEKPHQDTTRIIYRYGGSTEVTHHVEKVTILDSEDNLFAYYDVVDFRGEATEVTESGWFSIHEREVYERYERDDGPDAEHSRSWYNKTHFTWINEPIGMQPKDYEGFRAVTTGYAEYKGLTRPFKIVSEPVRVY